MNLRMLLIGFSIIVSHFIYLIKLHVIFFFIVFFSMPFQSFSLSFKRVPYLFCKSLKRRKSVSHLYSIQEINWRNMRYQGVEGSIYYSTYMDLILLYRSMVHYKGNNKNIYIYIRVQWKLLIVITMYDTCNF